MESRREEKVDRERKEVEEQPKKPYSTPKLTRYGPVEEFTNQYGDFG